MNNGINSGNFHQVDYCLSIKIVFRERLMPWEHAQKKMKSGEKTGYETVCRAEFQFMAHICTKNKGIRKWSNQLSSLGVWLWVAFIFLYTFLYFLNCLKWTCILLESEKNTVNKCMSYSTHKNRWYCGGKAYAKVLHPQMGMWVVVGQKSIVPLITRENKPLPNPETENLETGL